MTALVTTHLTLSHTSVPAHSGWETRSCFTHLVHFLLPLSGHGGAGGVPPVGDGVEHPGGVAAGLVDLSRVPPGQDLPQGWWDHAVLVAGHVDQVAADGIELQGAEGSRISQVIGSTEGLKDGGWVALLPPPACRSTLVHPAGRCPRGSPASQTPVTRRWMEESDHVTAAVCFPLVWYLCCCANYFELFSKKFWLYVIKKQMNST